MATLLVAVPEYIWPLLLLTVKGTGTLSAVVMNNVIVPILRELLKKPTKYSLAAVPSEAVIESKYNEVLKEIRKILLLKLLH